MPDPSLGEVASWAMILALVAFLGARRFGSGPAVAAAALTALGVKAALLNLG